MSRYFVFVQFEFTHAVGPHAARYIVATEPGGEARDEGSIDPALDERNRQLAGTSRGVGEADVLVVSVVGVAPAPRRLLRRARPVQADAPLAPVPLSVVTFVKGTEPIDDPRTAAGRLDALRYSEAGQRRLVDEGLAVLNRAIRAYRLGAPDPYATEVTRRDARRVRIGFGTTEQVQDGDWEQAVEPPPEIGARPSRTERLRPAEAVAAVLAGRWELFDAEDLLLRALVELDQGRTRAAAHQAAAAMRLLRVELDGRDVSGLDVPALAEQARRAQQLADAPELPDPRAIESIVDGVAAALDTWRAVGAPAPSTPAAR